MSVSGMLCVSPWHVVGMLLACPNGDSLAHSMSLAFLDGEVLAHGLGGLG